MSQEQPQDRLEEIISQAADLGSVQFDRAKWLERLKEQPQRQRKVHPHAWRRIMNSPYTRVAAALAIGLAVFSTLFPSGNGIIPASVAIADVQKAVQAKETVYATGRRTITFAEKPTLFPPLMAGLFERPANEDGSFTLEFTAESFISPQGYATKIYAKDGTLVMQAGLCHEVGKATVLLPTAKAYAQFDVAEAFRQRMAGITIQGFIDAVYKSGDYRKVGPKRMHGVDAVGFEVDGWDERAVEGVNPRFVKLLFNLQGGTGRVWIDPKTNLPVRSESELTMKPCVVSFFKAADMNVVDNHFQWDVEIDETVFRPEIPEGYEKLTLPSKATVGAVASGIVLAGVAPWCLLIRRRRCRRKVHTVR